VVVVNTQGGSTNELFPAEEILNELGRGDDVYVLTVHQVQTLNPADFTDADLSFDNAIAGDEKSVQTPADVVREQVDRGNEVYVLGVSFGEFMIADLLAEHGDIADGYIVANGRLDMPDAVWNEFAEGRAAGFIEVVEVAIEDAGMALAHLPVIATWPASLRVSAISVTRSCSTEPICRRSSTCMAHSTNKSAV
jgi:hypothetical protein